MARIQLITDKTDLPADRYEEFDAICAVLGSVAGPFSVLFHSPGLAQKVMEAGAHVRLNSLLTMIERELVVLSVAREKDAAAEWSGHVRIARTAGMREDAIVAIRDRKAADNLEPDERDIITFVRQLLRTNRVDQMLFDRLLERHGVRWLVELAATAGQYQYISAITGTFDLQPAPGAELLPR